jgi:hypothetical protein
MQSSVSLSCHVLIPNITTVYTEFIVAFFVYLDTHLHRPDFSGLLGIAVTSQVNRDVARRMLYSITFSKITGLGKKG